MMQLLKLRYDILTRMPMCTAAKIMISAIKTKPIEYLVSGSGTKSVKTRSKYRVPRVTHSVNNSIRLASLESKGCTQPTKMMKADDTNI